MRSEHFPEKYFDDIAQINPDNNYFSPVWDAALKEVGEIHTMLDVGCGNGIFSAKAKRKTGCRLVGVDGSHYALKEAKVRGFDQLAPINDFNTDPLPFTEAEFDFCLCKDLLEHLLKPDFMLSQIHRVLKSRGYLLVHVPNHFTLYGRLKFLFTNDIDTYRYFEDANRWDFPHIRFFTHDSLIKLLGSLDFTIIRDLSHHFPALPYGRYWLPLPSLREQLIRRHPAQFAEGFTFLARKA